MPSFTIQPNNLYLQLEQLLLIQTSLAIHLDLLHMYQEQLLLQLTKLEPISLPGRYSLNKELPHSHYPPI
ncbi:hypothetical protein BAOM_0279 [Peribacillus asahii]|uniref:Uncharacterized protein n=1 Tax=Peribacillus asahii TaxID=228899 RepID=A0A3Q9RJS1_9BACI|nr:hypothetical protein BAOM_0279 [Peribacillus asahii]